MSTLPISFDQFGRMKYHPDYHAKQGTPRSTRDQQFLIDNYDKIGPEETSFALERTVSTIMTRAYELRVKGLMIKPVKIKHCRRTITPERVL